MEDTTIDVALQEQRGLIEREYLWVLHVHEKVLSRSLSRTRAATTSHQIGMGIAGKSAVAGDIK